MMMIEQVSVHCQTDEGDYVGALRFTPGLNVITARNGFGKTLALTAIAWCLRLEPIFGVGHDDNRLFTRAVLSELRSDEAGKMAIVNGSWAELRVSTRDGDSVVIRRSIHGGDPTVIEVSRYDANGDLAQEAKLNSRAAFSDETGGFQPYLFDALGLPRQPLLTSQGRKSWLYFENLAPFFFVEQINGWTAIAATQVHRYRLVDVNSAAIEYLIGAQSLLESRLVEQTRNAREAELRSEATAIREQVSDLLGKQGWTVDLGSHTALKSVVRRWKELDLKLALRDRHTVDFSKERELLDNRTRNAREKLSGKGPAREGENATVWNGVSREAVDLKQRRATLSTRAAELRLQVDSHTATLRSVEGRIQSTKDLLRLKTEGIGVLPHAECPTCHRELELATFELEQRSAGDTRAHLSALEADRRVVRRAIETAQVSWMTVSAELANVDERLRERERTLASINAASGPQREVIAKAAHDLAAAERDRAKLIDLERSIGEMQRRMRNWVAKAEAFLRDAPGESAADQQRLAVLRDNVADALIAVDHTGVDGERSEIQLDEGDYQPLYRGRKVQSLGSGSDHARLVAAYSTALLRTALTQEGNHPGVIVLDEPLQQNPDERHGSLAIRFWADLGRWLDAHGGQVIVLTVLSQAQLTELAEAGVDATNITKRHFLEKVPDDKATAPQD